MKAAIVYYSRHHGNTKKLIDAIAAYGAKWARKDGFPDLAQEMEKKMGISKGIQAMIEPEPKQKSQKKDDLVL